MKLRTLLAIAAAVAAPAVSQAYTFDSDVPQAVQDQITTDMDFMAAMEGAQGSALHGEIFGSAAINGGAYKSFFETRVSAVGMNPCGGGNAVACVIPWLGSSRIWLTQHYVNFSHPQVAKMMVVFHEARHTEVENGNWGHATCPDPFLNENGEEIKSIWTGASLGGEAACDETAYGSYSSSMILLKNISKYCTNCNEKVRQDAGLYADDQFQRVTDDGARGQIIADLYTPREGDPIEDPVLDPPGYWDPNPSWPWPNRTASLDAPADLIQR